MRRQQFRTNAANIIIAKALLRNAILNQPTIRPLLSRFIYSLNLNNRIKSGELTPVDALIELEHALQFAARKLHTHLNYQWSYNKLDQTDLSNPINMQTALANPNSYACQLMNDIAQAVIDDINEQIFENDITNQQIIAAEEKNTDESSGNQNEKDTDNDATGFEKMIIRTIELFDEKGADASKDHVESIFFKHTGIETEFHVTEIAAEASILDKILKPELKPTMDHHIHKEKE